MVAALFSLLGGHYALLQSVAWSQMLWNYSREERSLLAGAEKTFGGEAPCDMCKAVKKSKEKEEQAPPILKVEKKAEALASLKWTELPVPAGAFAPRLGEAVQRLVGRTDAPAAPVPLS
jgi:hypothetical protein